jgi:hypothetical protein
MTQCRLVSGYQMLERKHNISIFRADTEAISSFEMLVTHPEQKRQHNPERTTVNLQARFISRSSQAILWLARLPLDPRFAVENQPRTTDLLWQYKFAASLPSEEK